MERSEPRVCDLADRVASARRSSWTWALAELERDYEESLSQRDGLRAKIKGLPRAKWGDMTMADGLRKCADEDVIHRTFLLEVADALEVVLARAEAAEAGGHICGSSCPKSP